VSGATPLAGPSIPVRSPGLLAHPGAGAGSRSADFERPLCVGRDGFTLHAATSAGGADLAGREALLKYDPGKSPTGDIVRPAVAQERIVAGKDGLVRITLKRAFSDGTVAIDMDPLSLLSRLAAAVPYPRFSPFGDHEARHTVRYSGVLASASKVRQKIAPKQESVGAENMQECVHDALECEVPKRGPYRAWAELLKRTFHFDVLQCTKCQGRMRLLAVLTQDRELRCYLRGLGEATELPTQASARAPPYWRSRAFRRREPSASLQPCATDLRSYFSFYEKSLGGLGDEAA
jgi:hypothetical protein